MSASSTLPWMPSIWRRSIPTVRSSFLGVGFETTAPGVAASILEAEAKGLKNYFVFSLHKLTPPATRAILELPVK